MRKLSDTMLLTMLDALTSPVTAKSGIRYQAHSPARTVTALTTRGMAETIDEPVRYTPSTGATETRPAVYLTGEGLTYLRRTLITALGARGEDRPQFLRTWLTTRGHADALAMFLLNTPHKVTVVTRTPQALSADRETLGRRDGVEQFGNILRNGQRLTSGDDSFTAHTKLGATLVFTPLHDDPGPAVPVDADRYHFDLLDTDGTVYAHHDVPKGEAARLATPRSNAEEITIDNRGVITVRNAPTNLGPRTHVLTPLDDSGTWPCLTEAPAPITTHYMRTRNDGTPQRIPAGEAVRETVNAQAQAVKQRQLAAWGDSDGVVVEVEIDGPLATIDYHDVRGTVHLRPATEAETNMPVKPKGEQYAPGDQVIVRGTFYRHEDRRTYVLEEYTGTVTNPSHGDYYVRANQPDEHGAGGVRLCRADELRPLPPKVEDVVDAAHVVHIDGEPREGITD